MEAKAYEEFIDEAFVRPIRSVLIVDDDYPTFDELLSVEIAANAGEPPARSKGWYANPDRIKRVIDRFRSKERPLLVDIHDGSNVTPGEDREIAAHLHQSDLLVLDYSLDPQSKGDGSRALAIIRSLVDNRHFNMVVVHTGDPLDGVFRDTLLSLLRPVGPCLSAEERADADGHLFEAETAQEGMEDRLIASVGDVQYLASRSGPHVVRQAMRGEEPFAQFRALTQQLGWRGDVARLVLRRLLERADERLAGTMTGPEDQTPTWSSGDARYIQMDSVFLAFSNKHDEEDLIQELRSALAASRPEPSRLFHAKLRAEMDEMGTVAQRAALENKPALAHWYHRLVEANGATRKWLVADNVSRHAEQLLTGILPGVQDFASRLVAAEGAGDPVALSKTYFGVDLSNEAVRRRAEREHNAYVSCRPRSGWHLTTGHVFLLGEDLWVCVSPMCDMVPNQMSEDRRQRLGSWLPFTAVKLVPVAPDREKDVSSNRFLFIPGEGEVRTFCFNDPSRDASAPAWYTLYAENLGALSDGFQFRAVIPMFDGGGLSNSTSEATVVAQLRHEYALSLVHRLGGTQTRVGLDYVG
jgi:CheY-like chemotaxis protein